MVDVLTQIPKSIIAGDTFSWQRDLADYPAGTWSLVYYFSNGADSFTITASASGTTHVLSAAAAVTGAYLPGRYKWFARVSDGTTVKTIADGWLEVRANVADPKIDWRSWAQKMVDAIEAALLKQASAEQLDLLSYSFGAVNVSRDRAKLIELRDKLKWELAADGGADGIYNSKNLFVRFDRV